VVEEHDKGCWEDGCGQYANFIVVMHDDGTTGEYYHLQQDGSLVEVGDKVIAGQQIGLSGNTGHTTMPHLHFAVYRATNRARPQSIPVNFISADGVVHQPRRGHRYLAVAYQQAGD
jgi:murein DD-endopeptidase MepM/ murein hydrolase activator NlpD